MCYHTKSQFKLKNMVRQNKCCGAWFHITNLWALVDRVAKDCQHCKITKSKPYTPRMSPLPVERLTAWVHPFSYVGVDFLGPVDVTNGRRNEKRYVAVFTCLVTRAVHLEMVYSLSTDACIMAIRRFVARRGTPIFFDNGTNFVGARNILKQEIVNNLQMCRYVYQFLHKLVLQSAEHDQENCSNKEFCDAAKLLVKILQRQEFGDELLALRKGDKVSLNSRLKYLRPFSNPKGVLRVGGHFEHATIGYGAKHYLILPAKTNFIRILVKAYHQLVMHSGSRQTLALVWQEFWILSGKAVANAVCRSCVTCFKVCLCLSTKAVHIELGKDFSTGAFISAFRRLISRRGLPIHVYSDNGLNFQGAQKELLELFGMLKNKSAKAIVQSEAVKLGITWSFIPPRSPNFGGLWEAAVKAAKRTMRKVLGDRQLSFGDFVTVLTQIEAQLNSRPLTPLSEDPRELVVLNPGHFLIGISLLALPDQNVLEVPMNRLKLKEQLHQIGKNICEDGM
uniref:Integrase catalytic domain-containing protein n=1 Tax=Anopheles quadriannulatus TaxID=34691 RepID=A0A182X1M9_ANOQN